MSRAARLSTGLALLALCSCAAAPMATRQEHWRATEQLVHSMEASDSSATESDTVAAHEQKREHEHWHESPHHLSLVTGGTHEDDEDAFTVGTDYEYRLNGFLGVGAVAEYAFNPIDTTTLLGVADLHLWRGLVCQTGPGVVFDDGDGVFVYRVGGKPDALVYALAVGRAF